MKIVSVVGARPNFVKIAPLLKEWRQVPGVDHILVHSGQHYDDQLSASFFRDLNLPEPDVNLQVGSGSHAWQTAEIMKRVEPVLIEAHPDLVIVVGDVNSTIATALTAAKLNLRLAHVEAGLRSFDNTMPEEINRKLTDVLADFLFVTEQSGVENLLREGIGRERIFLVGNVMIDSLFSCRAAAARSTILRDLGLLAGDAHTLPYGILTLHRPSNVDHLDTLQDVLGSVRAIAQDLPVLFPVHPRTQERIRSLGLESYFNAGIDARPSRGIIAIPPLGYLDFLCLMDHASVALTDSGGIQEETTALGVPCLTLRENTERPITISEGTNHLVGLNPEAILSTAQQVLRNDRQAARRPPLWDGQAAERIVKTLLEQLRRQSLAGSTVDSAPHARSN